MDSSTIAYNISDESKLVSPPRVATGDGTRPLLTSSSPRSSDGNMRLLTRKKWLESSEGGFIFGSPSQTKGSLNATIHIITYHVHVHVHIM